MQFPAHSECFLTIGDGLFQFAQPGMAHAYSVQSSKLDVLVKMLLQQLLTLSKKLERELQFTEVLISIGKIYERPFLRGHVGRIASYLQCLVGDLEGLLLFSELLVDVTDKCHGPRFPVRL